jgi:hypothetical protein
MAAAAVAEPIPWQKLWTPSPGSSLNGWVSTVEEAEDIRREFEIFKCTTYVSKRKTRNFGKNTGE